MGKDKSNNVFEEDNKIRILVNVGKMFYKYPGCGWVINSLQKNPQEVWQEGGDSMSSEDVCNPG